MTEETKKAADGVDAGARKAILKFATALHGAVLTHPASHDTVQKAFDELRIELGDEEHADHIVLREHAQAQFAVDSFSGDNAKERRALDRRLEKAEKAMQERPTALQKHQDLADARKESRKVSAVAADDDEA